MFKIEDATPPERFKPKKVKRVFTIEATEEEFDRLVSLMGDVVLFQKDEAFWNEFVRHFENACCW